MPRIEIALCSRSAGADHTVIVEALDLPTALMIADINTPAVFGNYIDVYDIAQAVEDGATVRIYYESRLAKVNLSEEGKQLVEDLESELEDELTENQKAYYPLLGLMAAYSFM